jgi:hypothetical protein
MMLNCLLNIKTLNTETNFHVNTKYSSYMKNTHVCETFRRAQYNSQKVKCETLIKD